MQRLVHLLCLGVAAIGLTSCGLAPSSGDKPNTESSASLQQLEQRLNQLELELQELKTPGGEKEGTEEEKRRAAVWMAALAFSLDSYVEGAVWLAAWVWTRA